MSFNIVLPLGITSEGFNFVSLPVVIAQPNLTGRKYVCLKNYDDYIDSFEDGFKFGGKYNEAIQDSDGDRLHKKKLENNTTMLLFNEQGVTQYVNSSGFELSEDRINHLDLFILCLN